MGIIRKSPSPSRSDAPLTPEQRAEVARIAYDLYLRRGAGHGSDQQDWLTAEAIVRERAKRRVKAKA